jgi:hypothetical protein
MKKIIIALLGIFSATLVFSQTSSPKTVVSGKIMLSPGQKIVVESNISMDADLSMGMQMTSTSASVNMLEAKSSTDKNYTVSNTLTKVKVNMNMMGQPTNYDSEKKEDNNSDIAKSFEDKLNKPVDIIIDNETGKAIKSEKKEVKKETDDENPMNGLLDIFSQSSDDAVVTSAFELIPAGKQVGDNWQDSTITKDVKTVRTYTLKSVTGNEALIQLDAVTKAANKLELQGMEMEFKSETKSTGEIITDINTGQVKKRSTRADITGSFQLMGQDVPITAKATTNSTYK